MMNPVLWLQMTNMISYQGLVRTFLKAMGIGWLKTIIPFLLVCMFTTILVSWFQSKMQLATEAVKFKFDSLNPVNGLKRIFGLKTVKEFVKAILYIIFFCIGDQSILE